MKFTFWFIASWAIVAFGQPAWIPWLAPFSASLGFGFFWKAVEESKHRFWLATGWFALVQMIQLSWMTATEFQGAYILGVYAFLCLWMGAQFGCITFLMGRIPLLATASIWTLLEWARLYFFCGFSWNPLGLALTVYTPSLQFASVFGILGLSFWVVLTNLAAWKKRKWAWAVFAAFPYLFGIVHLAWHDDKVEQSSKLSVGLFQTGLMPPQKIFLSEKREEFISPFDQWNTIVTRLGRVQEKLDLIVLPEHAVPFSAELKIYPFEKTKTILERAFHHSIAACQEKTVSNMYWLQHIADHFGAEVVAGLDSSEGKKHYAAAFLFSPHEAKIERYEKRVLVPLGEYIPFAWLKYFTKKYGIFEFFTHGEEAKVFHSKIPLSLSVCYEETFSHLMREGRSKGAELFVNVTNDNWYPHSKLPQQHFDHAKVRAVENGVPLVRSCNTGVTAAVDSLGRVLGKITEEQRCDLLILQVPSYHYKTLYALWGDWAIVIVCILLLGIISLVRNKILG